MSQAIQSPVLGRLTYNEQLRHYATNLVHNRATIQVALRVDSANAIDNLLPFAERIWKGRSRHIKAFRDYAVTELLDELNQFLIADNQRSELISPQQMQRILRVPFSMTFNLDRNNCDKLEFCLSGGEAVCLREHCLSVFFAADGSIKGGEVVRLF